MHPSDFVFATFPLGLILTGCAVKAIDYFITRWKG